MAAWVQDRLWSSTETWYSPRQMTRSQATNGRLHCCDALPNPDLLGDISTAGVVERTRMLGKDTQNFARHHGQCSMCGTLPLENLWVMARPMMNGANAVG